ncbi:MAG: GNAT family N-acetyltransferase [Betaproteobacteria bacterium]
MQHYLAPLLKPQSVALVGASDTIGSLGRTVYENILAGAFNGEVYAVNPNRRKVFGRRTYTTLGAIDAPVDLAVIAAPPAAVPGILDDPKARIRAAVLMSFPDTDNPSVGRTWRREVLAVAKRRGIRLVGPGAFGVVRTDIGLNATFCAPTALSGRLALVSQSGAVCTAMLDFATQMQIGFSTVISLGGGIDVGFGELLDALVLDPGTDGILLYVEAVGAARPFLSALRAAARIKPVVVLKGGVASSAADIQRGGHAPTIAHDIVFDAALKRAGTVRVHNYTQLFAAARILAMGRIPAGDRLAIVANGRGPGMLAADGAAAAGVTLARFSQPTVDALSALLPPEIERINPVDVRGDAPPSRLAAAVAATLADPGVDAVLVLHVPRPIIGALESARAVAGVARGSAKPVLAAWLGALNRQGVHEALEAGGIANFFTPENAVNAFAFLAAYKRHQEWLLEVPASTQGPAAPDLVAAERLRERAANARWRLLPAAETKQLLHVFGIEMRPFVVVETLAEARAAARELHYPLTLRLEGASVATASHSIANSRALARAWGEWLPQVMKTPPPGWEGGVILKRTSLAGTIGAFAITMATDPVFGPVIAVGSSALALPAQCASHVMLAPLNPRLAGDLLAAAGITAPRDELIHLLVRVSAIACALPWVRQLTLDPVVPAPDGLEIVSVQVVVDPRQTFAPGYRHMAIHPYPGELESQIELPDGTHLMMRPVRPEDADLERRFVASLSEQTRFFRFFYRLHELSPAMLVRFTQVDYDRELALLALVADRTAPQGESVVGIARYIQKADLESAEFAIVVADAWHRRGVAGRLMRALIACATRKGLHRLVGTVLRANQNMLRFTAGLGFTVSDDPDDPDQVVVELALR